MVRLCVFAQDLTPNHHQKLKRADMMMSRVFLDFVPRFVGETACERIDADAAPGGGE